MSPHLSYGQADPVTHLPLNQIIHILIALEVNQVGLAFDEQVKGGFSMSASQPVAQNGYVDSLGIENERADGGGRHQDAQGNR